MVWQPTGSFGAPDQEIRCGTLRGTMASNPLLSRPELGKVKKCQFNDPTQDHVFGYTAPRDPEGAREVTMLWKEHQPSLGQAARPQADFKTMNKLAADHGLTTAKEQPAFRQDHLVTIKPFDHTAKQAPQLPTSKDVKHTYGMASAHRSAEVVRTHGPEEPPVKYLVQGAYQEDWVYTNCEKDATRQAERPYIPPAPTRAVLGHSFGASKYLQPPNHEEPWKMNRFKSVGPKVTQFMGKSA